MDIKKLEKYLDKKIIIPLILIFFLIIVIIVRSSFALWNINLEQNTTNRFIVGGTTIYNYVKDKSKGLDTTNNINYHVFSSDTNGNGVYATTKTSSGKSVYFYRGSVTDNNVIFANLCWKIVRTTEENGVRLIYNGIPAEDGSCYNTSVNSTIGENSWNKVANDHAYVGYMTGEVDATTYLQANSNSSNSFIKNMIDTWYYNKIANTAFESLVIDSVYCNDKSLESDWSNYKYSDWIDKSKITQYGYGKTYFSVFKGTSRVGTAVGNSTPTLVCEQNNDKYTKSTSIGNGKLTYPVGLLTADEAVFAGSKGGILENQNMANPNMYLTIGGDKHFWTMTPHRYYNNSIIYLAVNNAGVITNEAATNSMYIRPVITIKENTPILQGDGSSKTPFVLTKDGNTPLPPETNPSTIPVDYQDNGIFKDYYEKAYSKVRGMTLEEKVGQLLVVRYKEPTTLNDAVRNYNVGGTTFYAVDFNNKTKNEVKEMISNLQTSTKIPLITAVDEEGGKVVRISSNKNLVSEPFKSSKELYEGGGFEAIVNDTINKSAILSELGINVNYAPVVDISDETAYIYDRTIGQTTEITAEYASKVIEASKSTKVSYTLKHFPGYGNAADNHTGSATDESSIEELRNKHLIPFKKGIESKAEAVMITHNIVSAVDTQNPASLSKAVHDILFNDLKFTGIAITDDLDMGSTSNIEDNYTKAIQAGNNIIICSNYQEAQANILKSIENSTLTEEQITKLAFKVLAWKYYKGLLT